MTLGYGRIYETNIKALSIKDKLIYLMTLKLKTSVCQIQKKVKKNKAQTGERLFAKYKSPKRLISRIYYKSFKIS